MSPLKSPSLPKVLEFTGGDKVVRYVCWGESQIPLQSHVWNNVHCMHFAKGLRGDFSPSYPLHTQVSATSLVPRAHEKLSRSNFGNVLCMCMNRVPLFGERKKKAILFCFSRICFPQSAKEIPPLINNRQPPERLRCVFPARGGIWLRPSPQHSEEHIPSVFWKGWGPVFPFPISR